VTVLPSLISSSSAMLTWTYIVSHEPRSNAYCSSYLVALITATAMEFCIGTWSVPTSWLIEMVFWRSRTSALQHLSTQTSSSHWQAVLQHCGTDHLNFFSALPSMVLLWICGVQGAFLQNCLLANQSFLEELRYRPLLPILLYAHFICIMILPNNAMVGGATPQNFQALWITFRRVLG
jgi:hypothetical protein